MLILAITIKFIKNNDIDNDLTTIATGTATATVIIAPTVITTTIVSTTTSIMVILIVIANKHIYEHTHAQFFCTFYTLFPNVQLPRALSNNKSIIP